MTPNLKISGGVRMQLRHWGNSIVGLGLVQIVGLSLNNLLGFEVLAVVCGAAISGLWRIYYLGRLAKSSSAESVPKGN
jgi:hypothetical protein